jgi:hypothetical protein
MPRPEGEGRAAHQQPGPATTPTPRRTAASRIAVGPIPHEGPDRVAWLDALQWAVEGDAAATRAAMVAQGWDEADARRAYIAWWRRLIHDALSRGWSA